MKSRSALSKVAFFLKNDVIVMVSDGFEFNSDFIAECCKSTNDCLSTVNKIAEKKNQPYDDATVIVAKLT